MLISGLFGALGLFSLIIFLKRVLKSQRAVILMYHRVFDMVDESTFPYYLVGPSVKDFERQMKYISLNCNVIGLEELADLLREGRRILPNTVAVTVDDGYVDCYVNMFPIFSKYRIPATIFLSTGYIGTHNLFWWDEVAYRQKRAKKAGAIDLLIREFKRLPEEDRIKAMEKLRKDFGFSEPIETKTILTWDEVGAMRKAGIDFGAHTVSHPILSRCRDEKAEREIVDSKKRIEEETKKPVTTFCYPSGEPDTFGECHKKVLRDNGFMCAVSTVSGPVTAKSGLFALERISVDKSDTMALFKAKLSGIFEIKRLLGIKSRK